MLIIIIIWKIIIIIIISSLKSDGQEISTIGWLVSKFLRAALFPNARKVDVRKFQVKN